MRLCWALLIGATVLCCSCDTRRDTAPSQPGETPRELDAAGEVLAAVGDGVPLIEVQVSSVAGDDLRRTVGAVIDEDGQIIVGAGAVATEDGQRRSIEAVFHPGLDSESRYPAVLVRENAEIGLAVLSIEGAPLALRFSDDVPDDARVFRVSAPLNMRRLVVRAGRVQEYVPAGDRRLIRHTAGGRSSATGPLLDADGEIVGLEINGDGQARGAVPAVEIVQWLETPPANTSAVSASANAVEGLLRQVDVHFRVAEEGVGYVVEPADGPDVQVREAEGVISVVVALGTLHAGDAIEALRANYSDPVGALALHPAGREEQLSWVARVPVDEANAAYLGYVLRMASAQATRWRQLEAGLDPGYPHDLYPGGDGDAHDERLQEIIEGAEPKWERSGEGYKLNPESAVPIFVNAFRGVAYIYAYSGGLPGAGPAEKEQTARRLLRRNWSLRLGRLALDKHRDLAWEAQVPIDHLSPGHLETLVEIGAAEIAALQRKYGEVSFNEQ